jgi:hypothetical protein
MRKVSVNPGKHQIILQVLAIVLLSIIVGVAVAEYHQFEQEQNAMNALRKYDREYELETKQFGDRFDVIVSVNLQTLPASGFFTYRNLTLKFEVNDNYFRITEIAGPSCALGKITIMNCQGWVKVLLTQVSDFYHSERYYWMAGIVVGGSGSTSLLLINYVGAPVYWHLYLYLVTT